MAQGGSGRRKGEEAEDHGRDQLMVLCSRLESVDSSGSWKGRMPWSRDCAIRLVFYRLPGKRIREEEWPELRPETGDATVMTGVCIQAWDMVMKGRQHISQMCLGGDVIQ